MNIRTKNFLTLLFVFLFCIFSNAHAQTYPQIPTSDLPAPPVGSSPYLMTGDSVTADRTISGIPGTYGIVYNPAGSCSVGLFVTSINAFGQPTCALPNFSSIAGTISLPQLGLGYSDGQLLIGDSATGQLVANTITAGSGVTITNGNGSITVAASAASGATLGTSSLTTNPQRSGQNGTGLYSAAGGLVDIAGLNSQVAEFSTNGLSLVVGNYSGAGSGLTGLNASGLSVGTVAPARLGQSYTNGQILIGVGTTGQLLPGVLTAGSGVTVTNGPGAITIAATASGGITPVNTVASSGASQTISFPASGSVSYDVTLTANCTFTLTGGTPGQLQTIVLILNQDTTAGRVATLPSGILWPAGIAPTVNTTAGVIDVFRISTPDGGVTLIGSY